MTLHLTEHRDGFGPGLTEITRLDETEDGTGIAFGVLKLAAGETHEETPEHETAWLLMAGKVTVEVAGQTVASCRREILAGRANPTGLTLVGRMMSVYSIHIHFYLDTFLFFHRSSNGMAVLSCGGAALSVGRIGRIHAAPYRSAKLSAASSATSTT